MVYGSVRGSANTNLTNLEKVLTHKDNNNLHYPALKQLINNFYNKWANKDNKTIVNVYRSYLKSILRSEFGR